MLNNRNRKKAGPAGRVHRLEVRSRPGIWTRQRLAKAGIWFGGLLGTAFAVLVIWQGGEVLFNTLVFRNDAFKVESIVISSNGEISPVQLRRWSGVRESDNLLALDLRRIKRNLELVPMIRSASVERLMPRTLRIRVVERKPVARAFALKPMADREGYEMVAYLVDAEGMVMAMPDNRIASKPEGFSWDKLPALIGVQGRDLQPGNTARNESLLAALDLIETHRDAGMVAESDIKYVDVSGRRTLEVTTHRGSRITFGMVDFVKQITRWRLVEHYAAKKGLGIDKLDLSIERHLPATFAEGGKVGEVPPPPAYQQYLEGNRHV